MLKGKLKIWIRIKVSKILSTKSEIPTQVIIVLNSPFHDHPDNHEYMNVDKLKKKLEEVCNSENVFGIVIFGTFINFVFWKTLLGASSTKTSAPSSSQTPTSSQVCARKSRSGRLCMTTSVRRCRRLVSREQTFSKRNSMIHLLEIQTNQILSNRFRNQNLPIHRWRRNILSDISRQWRGVPALCGDF